jgi:hypothetical protein
MTAERRLLRIVDRRLVGTPADLAGLVPIPDGQFTTAGLAEAMGRPRWLARKAAYCLRAAGSIVAVGKRGNAVLYARVDCCD